MDKLNLQTLILHRFGAKVEFTEIEKMPWFRDESTQFSWKDHLTRISKRRLKNCTDHDGPSETIEELTRFLNRIAKLQKEDDLCYFCAESSSIRFSGWTVGEEIGFCLPTEKTTQ